MAQTGPVRLLSTVRVLAPYAVGAAFAISGVAHFVSPQTFIPLVPRALPAPTALIYLSGAAELVCAAGLALRARWAGPASALLLLAVWPGNVQMALDAGSGRNSGLADDPAIAWARVPLQVPLIWAALQARRPGESPIRRTQR